MPPPAPGPPPISRSQPPEALKRELRAFLAARLAKYAVPDDVAFVPEIPHNATGKVSKLTLRASFKDYRPAGSKL